MEGPLEDAQHLLFHAQQLIGSKDISTQRQQRLQGNGRRTLRFERQIETGQAQELELALGEDGVVVAVC